MGTKIYMGTYNIRQLFSGVAETPKELPGGSLENSKEKDNANIVDVR